MAIERTIKINVDSKNAVEGLDDINQAANEVQETVGTSVDNIGDSLDSLGGSAGQAVGGVKSLGKAFKALLANPIGLVITAVVGAITLLFKAFQRTAVGGDKLAKVFEGISAAMGPVLDALGRFASGLVSFLSGDFTKGIEEMGSAFNGLGEEIKTAYNNAALLVDLRRELQQMNRELVVGESEITAQMDRQRSILDDIDKPIQERIAANERLNELNLELLASRQALIDKQLEEAELQKEQAGADDAALQESLDRIAELTAARNNAEAERFRIEKEFVVKRNELRNQAFEEQKTNFEVQSESINTTRDIQVESELERIGIVNEATKLGVDYRISQAQLEVEAVQATEAQKLDAVKTGLQSAANLVQLFAGQSEKAQKKAFEAQKAVNIATTLIDTYKGAVGAATGMISTIPGPVGIALGAVAAAGVVTAGLLQVKKISQTQFKGGASGGSSSFTPSLAGSTDATQRSPQFNTVGNSGTNQIADVLNNQPPTRAYVVGKDVTTQQELDRNTVNTATF